MNTSENNAGDDAKNGTPPSELPPQPLPIFNEPFFKDEAARKLLSARRNVATSMFHFIEAHSWLESTPDHWIIAIMETLRQSATHLLDYEAFRLGLLKTGAAIFAAIEEGDRLNRINGGVMPLPESIFGKE